MNVFWLTSNLTSRRRGWRGSFLEARLLLFPLDSFAHKTFEALFDLLFKFLGEARTVLEGFLEEHFRFALDGLVQRSRESRFKRVLNDFLDVDGHLLPRVCHE